MIRTPPLRQTRLVEVESSEHGFTLAELLIVISISSIIMGVLASGFIVGADTAAAANTRLRESHDAQLATAYFVADASSATYFSTTTMPPLAACAVPGVPVALFQLVQAGVTKDVFYVVSGAPPQLVRHYCDSNSVKYDVSLVKNLSAAKTPIATCPPATTNCGTEPDHVQLQVWETSGYTFTLRATRRSAMSTGPASGSISAYVGSGGVTLQGSSTLTTAVGVVDVNSPTVSCAGGPPAISAPAGFFEGNPAPAPLPSCGATATNPRPDPLAGMAYPPAGPPPVGGDATFTDGLAFPFFGASYWSANAAFVASDVGKTIVGTDIPPGTTILDVSSSPWIQLSNAPTTFGFGLTFTIKNRNGAGSGPVNLNTCGFIGPTYQPGSYAGSIQPGSPGCLATGTYYLPANATLGNVTAQGTFSDGVATNALTQYTSAVATFTAADVGKTIAGEDIPANTVISAVTSATTVTLSAAAMGGGSSLTFSILNRDGMFTDGVAGNGSTTFTSATATFTADDVGNAIAGTNIAPGTTIVAVASTTTATLSVPATGGGSSLTFKILDRAGVVVYVAAGALTLDSVNLGPLASGPDAGITILMDRANSSKITIATSSAVNGIIYTPAGSLFLQAGVNLVSGGVNAQTLTLATGSSLVLP